MCGTRSGFKGLVNNILYNSGFQNPKDLLLLPPGRTLQDAIAALWLITSTCYKNNARTYFILYIYITGYYHKDVYK